MNKWLLRIIALVIPQVSPQIRDGLCSLLNELEAKAKETKNPWDDILIGLVKTILDCPEN